MNRDGDREHAVDRDRENEVTDRAERHQNHIGLAPENEVIGRTKMIEDQRTTPDISRVEPV